MTIPLSKLDLSFHRCISAVNLPAFPLLLFVVVLHLRVARYVRFCVQISAGAAVLIVWSFNEFVNCVL